MRDCRKHPAPPTLVHGISNVPPRVREFRTLAGLALPPNAWGVRRLLQMSSLSVRALKQFHYPSSPPLFRLNFELETLRSLPISAACLANSKRGWRALDSLHGFRSMMPIDVSTGSAEFVRISSGGCETTV